MAEKGKWKDGRRLLLILAAVLAAAVILAGCGASAQEEDVTLTYAMWQTNLTDYMNERITAFEAQNPHIHVVLKTYDNYQEAYAQYWKELDADKVSDLPDVFQMNATYIRAFQKENKLLDLDNLTGKDKIDMDNFPDALSQIYKVGGRQYGIPIDYDTVGLWYNKALFDQAGLDYPNRNWTWSDFTAAAARINTLDGGVHGIIAGNQEQLGYYNTVAAWGGAITENDAFHFTDDKTEAGIQYWVDLAKYSPTLAEIDASGGPHALFMQGKVGMVFGGDWEAADFTGSDSTVASVIGVTELPIMPNGKRATVIHGKANVISAGTRHPDAARKFLSFLSTGESYQKLGETGKCIPAHNAHSSLFFDQYPQYDMGIFAREAAECAVAYPTSSLDGWMDTASGIMEDVISGKVSVDDGCKQIMDALKAKAK